MLVAKLGDDTNFTTSSPQPNIRQKQSLKSAEQWLKADLAFKVLSTPNRSTPI